MINIPTQKSKILKVEEEVNGLLEKIKQFRSKKEDNGSSYGHEKKVFLELGLGKGCQELDGKKFEYLVFLSQEHTKSLWIKIPAEFNTGSCKHSSGKEIYVIKGKIKVNFMGDISYIIQAGDSMKINSSEVHSIESIEDSEMIVNFFAKSIF